VHFHDHFLWELIQSLFCLWCLRCIYSCCYFLWQRNFAEVRQPISVRPCWSWCGAYGPICRCTAARPFSLLTCLDISQSRHRRRPTSRLPWQFFLPLRLWHFGTLKTHLSPAEFFYSFLLLLLYLFDLNISLPLSDRHTATVPGWHFKLVYQRCRSLSSAFCWQSDVATAVNSAYHTQRPNVLCRSEWPILCRVGR